MQALLIGGPLHGQFRETSNTTPMQVLDSSGAQLDYRWHGTFTDFHICVPKAWLQAKADQELLARHNEVFDLLGNHAATCVTPASPGPVQAHPAASPMEIVLPDVIVRDTGTQRGLGVYAKKQMLAGEVVELCPVIAFDAPFGSLPQNLMTRVFDWGVLAGGPPHAIALGFGSIYNDSNPANMRYTATHQGRFLQFVAVRDIAQEEELTINYSGYRGSHEAEDDNWFERTGVTPIR